MGSVGEHGDKRTVQNFINGESVDAAGRRRLDLVDPTTGEVFGTAPVSGAEDVDRAYRAARRAFETWRDTTPRERQRALLKFADALEARAEEIIAAECENTGKPIELTRTEEIPPALDQIRFFAGAARVLEGRSAGEYMAGLHVLRPARAGRRRRPGDAVELPDDDGGLEVRAGAGRRQLRRAQAQSTPRRCPRR